MASSFFPRARPKKNVLRLLPGLCAAAGFLLPAAAQAGGPQPARVVSSDESLEGDLGSFESFTIKAGFTVTVPAFAAGTHPGWVQIQANTITIEAGAKIKADSAGYPGQPGMPGLCFPMMTCAGSGMGTGDPGGGGGYFGKGANGTSEATAGTCLDLGAAALGGAAFPATALDAGVPLGSAGGASNPGGGMTVATSGAAGGGGIRLSAGNIQMDGILTANGGTSNAFSGVSPGGGSGGTIVILAGKLTGTGTFSVTGGDGAVANGIGGAMGFPPNNGGGGSGGVVVLNLPSTASTSSFTFQLAGGKTGNCPNGTFGAPAGSNTVTPLPKGATCVDVDNDGFLAKSCGGTDCDDVDPSVHPGVEELCNGKDDDCDGKIDEAPNECTKMGLICVNAACVAAPPDGGVEDAGPVPDGGKPDHIDLTGGCTMPEGMPAQGGMALALGVAALALMASRRRRDGGR